MSGSVEVYKPKLPAQAASAMEHVQAQIEQVLAATMELVAQTLATEKVGVRDLTLLFRTMVEKYAEISALKASAEGDLAQATTDLERRSRDLLSAAQELVRRGQVKDITEETPNATE